MSAISTFITKIRTAVYGEQVRGAIADAIEQCYSDVNAPSLQTEAFAAALNAAYAGGILDIQTVTQISAMTNQAIIYRYNGTQAGYQKGLYYYSALSNSWVLIGSEIHAVSLVAQMTDTNAIYKYTGTQSGMVQNALYYHNGTDWLPISPKVETDKTLSDENSPADAKAVGDALDGLSEDITSLEEQIENDISDLEEQMDSIGLNDGAIYLLTTLLENALYKTNMSAEVEQLGDALRNVDGLKKQGSTLSINYLMKDTATASSGILTIT